MGAEWACGALREGNHEVTMMRIAYVLAVVLSVGLLAGCGSKSSCKKELGALGPEVPCQNASTADDAGAVGTPQCFVQAQVCPGKGGFPFCERPVGESFRDSVELTNTGESVLTIYSVVARGDTACAFIDPELRDPDGGVPLNINPQETILFSFRYAPPNEGRFNALVEFTSNAENFPVLRIPLCGIGVPAGSPPNPVDDAGVPTCGMMMCDDVSSAAPTSCGPGWVGLAGGSL
jgi:hypothetical protein